jgi:hypothetical protein
MTTGIRVGHEVASGSACGGLGFQFCTIRTGHRWGDDYAVYIHYAKNIGDPGAPAGHHPGRALDVADHPWTFRPANRPPWRKRRRKLPDARGGQQQESDAGKKHRAERRGPRDSHALHHRVREVH